MMKCFPLILIVFVFCSSPLKAILSTETHTYILDKKLSKLLIIDHQTLQESVLDVGARASSFQIYKDKGFVVHSLKGITVIDLKNHIIVHKINRSCGSGDMIIHGNIGFLTNPGRNSLIIINLETLEIESYPTSYDRYRFMAHQGFGYICGYIDGKVKVISLETMKQVYSVDIGAPIRSMSFHQSKGYFLTSTNRFVILDIPTGILSVIILPQRWSVIMRIDGTRGYITHTGSHEISVINLTCGRYVTRIVVPHFYNDFMINRDKGWIIYDEQNKIGVVDLMTLQIEGEINLKDPRALHFMGFYMFIEHENLEKYAVVYAAARKVQYVMSNPRKEELHVTERGIYLGLEKVRSLNVKTTNYKNLLQEALIVGDVEKAEYYLMKSYWHDDVTINLDSGALSWFIDYRFDPLEYLYEEPVVEEVLMDNYNLMSDRVTYIDQFVEACQIGDIQRCRFFFRRALQANDLYARAVMYAVFKNELCGTNGLKTLALFYKEGAHELTVKAMEDKFVKKSQDQL